MTSIWKEKVQKTKIFQKKLSQNSIILLAYYIYLAQLMFYWGLNFINDGYTDRCKPLE